MNAKYMFFDKDGEPIENVIEWAQKFEDPEYRIIAVDQDAPGQPMVSTIWQGLDLARNFNVDIPPMIFETVLMISKDDNPAEAKIVRSQYTATQEEAERAHRLFCEDHLLREPESADVLKREIVEREKG
jgi:hypothetical protein